jgi:hypothetical protein
MQKLLPIFLLLAFVTIGRSQTPQTTGATANVVVPRLVNFSGEATGAQGKAMVGVAGVTFAIYKDQHDGAPLWIETQNAQLDQAGKYAVQLGATKAEGLPLDLFSTGQARWLGVRINGGEEQPRVLLLSVPYALKAADAETVGGLPASAFVLAVPPTSGPASPSPTTAPASAAAPPPTAVTGSGTVNFLPLWTGASALGNSGVFQTGTGSTAKIGINTTTPASPLDINGGTTFRGPLSLVAMGTATAAAGKSSQFENISASAFSSSTGKAVPENFRLQAEAAGNNTATPGATLNLLFGSGASAPSETGLKIANNGIITFAPGQTFSGGSGSGTVTSVGLSAPSSDFTVSSSPVTSAGTLGLNWNVAPTSLDNANAIVKRDASGNFSASVIQAINVSATNNSGLALYASSTGTSGGSNGVLGVTTSAAASGVAGVNNSSGVGVYGASNGLAVYGISSGSQAVWGESNGTTFTNGSGPDGVHGVAHSSAGSGVGGLNTAAGGIGVWGEAPGGYGFYTPNNVQQARDGNGWVKVMMYVNAEHPPYKIERCFNSSLIGSQATTPPCGINFTELNLGLWAFDFAFQIDDRYYSATLAHSDDFSTIIRAIAISPNRLVVNTSDDVDGQSATFTVLIF